MQETPDAPAKDRFVPSRARHGCNHEVRQFELVATTQGPGRSSKTCKGTAKAR